MAVTGVIHANPPENFQLNNFEDGTTLYVGKAADSGVWRIQRYNTTTGVMDYATVTNNPAYLTYATAWTAHLTLTYGAYPQ
jgi:hypothetical protein